MKKEQVIGILGLGELSNRHFFYDNELAIDYDENDSVEFIEFLGEIEGTLHPVVYGMIKQRIMCMLNQCVLSRSIVMILSRSLYTFFSRMFELRYIL